MRPLLGRITGLARPSVPTVRVPKSTAKTRRKKNKIGVNVVRVRVRVVQLETDGRIICRHNLIFVDNNVIIVALITVNRPYPSPRRCSDAVLRCPASPRPALSLRRRRRCCYCYYDDSNDYYYNYEN